MIALLALVPKCPLCLAAYAGAVGIGLSLAGATVVRDIAVAIPLVLVGAWLGQLRDALID